MWASTTIAAALSAAVLAGSAGAAPPSGSPRGIEAVVRAWSARLNANDYAGLARLFRLPAVMTQGPYAYRLKTARQLAIWHAALPCGGKVTAVAVRGRYATATFRLANRPGSKCDAPGTLAAARFTVVRGKITAWRQVPVPQSGPVA